ncbi:peptidoglycan-binding protein [Streptomyces sp. NPDC058284]|uniref:peptidoglycan-binding domain-containing protein n=1 Tax=unclassified Streptomyces TaxID=2593676 RepID=UPI00366A2D12
MVLLAGAGGAAAVVAAAVFAAGLLASATDRPTRDRTLPGDPVSAYADPTKPAPPSAKSSEAASRTLSAPRTSRHAPPPPPPSPERSRRSAPRSSSPPPSAARATGSVGTSPSPSPPPEATDVTLREGDRGRQVAELQARLAQLYLYVGELDGSYTSQVTDAVSRYQWARGLTDDTRGEYGPQTRRSLESETTDP